MTRIRTIALVGLVSAASVLATADAGADCQSQCKKHYPDACYNIKPAKWAKSNDGIARVRFRNLGSFGGAFDWALEEINDPHNGKQPKLRLKAVESNEDVAIHDTADLCNQGWCGFWGLARTKWSGGHIVKAKIWLDTQQMNKNTHAKDLIVRKHVMLHEMLHTLGLNHACVNDNHTMWACGMPNHDYVHLPYMTGCDVNGLIALYGHQ
jgi:hypothetical protein